MGNSSSTRFLEPVESLETDWNEYACGEWRSERVRELDELGGPGRAAVQSGSSFTAKLQMLEEQLQEKRARMQEIISAPAKPKEPTGKNRKFMMHTDKRAAERMGELEDVDSVFVGHKELALAAKAGSVVSPTPVRGVLYPHNSAPPLVISTHSPTGNGSANGAVACANSRGRGSAVADWRKRVHAARRRTMIAIIAMLRLRKGHKHPQRPFRLDDVSFYIPEHLRGERERFIREYQKYLVIQEQVKTLEAALAEMGPRSGSGATAATAVTANGVHPPADPAAVPGSPLEKAAQSAFKSLEAEKGQEGGVLAQVTLPGMPPDMAPVRMYRSLVSHNAAMAAARTAAAAALGLADASNSTPAASNPVPVSVPAATSTKAAPARPLTIRRSSTDTGRSSRPNSGGSSSGGGAANGGGTEVRKILAGRPSDPEQDASARRLRAAGSSGNGSPVAAQPPTGPARLAGPGAHSRRGSGSNDGAGGVSPLSVDLQPIVEGQPAGRAEGSARRAARPPSSSGGGAASPGSGSEGASTPSSVRGFSESGSGGMSLGRRSSPVAAPMSPSRIGGPLGPGSLVLGGSMMASPPASGPRPVASSPGRAGWNSSFRPVSLSADSAPTPSPPRAASVDRARGRQLRSESQQYHMHSSPLGSAPASGATIAKVSRIHLQQQLKQEIELLQSSVSLLYMYLNRCNSRWADERLQQWAVPPVVGVAEEQMWSRSDQHEIYKADVIRKIRLGKVALQIFAGDDALDGAPGLPLWSTDPWTLVETCRPGMMPAGDRIKGVGLGARAMCNIVLQAMQLVGQDALDRMFIVLHLNEEQEQEVTQELWNRGFYGLNRTNFVFLVADQHPGFTFDSMERLFVKVDGDTAAATSRQPPGTGFCMSQMAWPSEAFILNDAGVKQPLLQPVMDLLHSSGVEWVVTRRLRDLAVFARDGALDVSALAHRLHMRERSRASFVVDVVLAETQATARQFGSLVLMQQAAGVGKSHTHEVSFSEMSSPQLLDVIDTMHSSGKLAVGLGRYMYHLPTVKGVMACSTLWRPKLQLAGSAVHVQLDMADLTSSHDVHCIAVETKRHPSLLHFDTVDALIPLAQAQDADPGFKAMVTEKVNMVTQSATLVAGQDLMGDEQQGLSIVVFVTNNTVAAKAVNTALHLARPGRDTVHLVTVVSAPMQRAEGQALLDDYARQALRLMLDVKADVLVRGTTGLLDCMEGYLASRCHAGATVVVLGSVQLTLSVFDGAVGSVAIAFLRRLVGLPVILVTTNAKHSPAPMALSALASSPSGGSPRRTSSPSFGPLRVMLSVEAHSRPLCQMVCGQLLSAKGRGDKLLMAQVVPSQQTSQQQANHRRLLESFQAIALGHRTPADKSFVLTCGAAGGGADDQLLQAVEEHAVGMLAIQVPSGSKTLPKPLLKIMRSCKGAVLIFQEAVAGDGALIKQMAAVESDKP